MTAAIRPAPWRETPPDGFHFEVVEQDSDWVTPPIGAGRCRMMSAGHRVCGRSPVASLMRNSARGKAPWDYCELHLYGRWIEDGKVMGWRLVEGDAPLTPPPGSEWCDGWWAVRDEDVDA